MANYADYVVPTVIIATMFAAVALLLTWAANSELQSSHCREACETQKLYYLSRAEKVCSCYTQRVLVTLP